MSHQFVMDSFYEFLSMLKISLITKCVFISVNIE